LRTRKNPQRSVAVVRMGPEARVGSALNLFNVL